jgi:hypothetical protein
LLRRLPLAGTIRIITNKPDPTKFEAGYNLDANRIDHGGTGWSVEGFVNIPLSSIAAVRLVGWDEHDGGYINNVAGTNTNACIQNGVRTFPSGSGQNVGSPAPYPCPSVGTVGAGAISNAAYILRTGWRDAASAELQAYGAGVGRVESKAVPLDGT